MRISDWSSDECSSDLVQKSKPINRDTLHFVIDVLPDLQNVLAISLDRTGILAVKRGLIARLELIQHTHSRPCDGLLGICRFIARDCCGKCGPFLDRKSVG